ncbi:MAG: hypothetical protein V4579_04320 [Pseudomonadota bacterium]
MTVRRDGDVLCLEGRCGAEDAETLLVALQEDPRLVVDASALLRLHLAVAQVLLACKPQIRAAPPDILLATTIFAGWSDM